MGEASGTYLWDTTATAAPLTRESLERGFQRAREMSTYQPPLQHLVNPRYHRGEWTGCSCGMYHRLKDGVHETAPTFDFENNAVVWPDGFFDSKGQDA